MKNDKIPIYIVEDDPTTREFLEQYCVQLCPGLTISGSSADGQTAIRECIELKPALIVVDIRVPEVNGLEILLVLKKRLPESRILIYSGNVNPDTLRIAINAKADGFVEKGAGIEELKKGIDTVLAGQRYYSRSIFKRIRGQSPVAE